VNRVFDNAHCPCGRLCIQTYDMSSVWICTNDLEVLREKGLNECGKRCVFVLSAKICDSLKSRYRGEAAY